MQQLENVHYFSQDKLDDPVYTFSRYWERFLAVNRLEQETNYYCGAASAQMILDFLHGWDGAPAISQDDLWDTIQTHVQKDAAWATDPPGLAGVLNDESPAVNRWAVYTSGELLPDLATKKGARPGTPILVRNLKKRGLVQSSATVVIDSEILRQKLWTT